MPCRAGPHVLPALPRPFVVSSNFVCLSGRRTHASSAPQAPLLLFPAPAATLAEMGCGSSKPAPEQSAIDSAKVGADSRSPLHLGSLGALGLALQEDPLRPVAVLKPLGAGERRARQPRARLQCRRYRRCRRCARWPSGVANAALRPAPPPPPQAHLASSPSAQKKAASTVLGKPLAVRRVAPELGAGLRRRRGEVPASACCGPRRKHPPTRFSTLFEPPAGRDS